MPCQDDHDLESVPTFTEPQIMWLEDLIINNLVRVWMPKEYKVTQGHDCHPCIKATEKVINTIRELREPEGGA